MTASVEEITAETVTRDISGRTEREFDKSLLGILPEECAHEHTVNLKGHIDESFGISFPVTETA